MTAGIGSEQMAAVVGVSRGTISNYENDHTDIPVKAVLKWAEITHVSVDWLIGVDTESAIRSRCVREAIRDAPEYMQQRLFALAA
jgi:transcriptional regulator with XRE-family HTH domain